MFRFNPQEPLLLLAMVATPRLIAVPTQASRGFVAVFFSRQFLQLGGSADSRWCRSGKALYRSVRTIPVVDWYADRPLSGGTAKIGRRRLILAVDGRLKKKKGRRRRGKKKEERRRGEVPRAILACAPPTRPRRPRVAR
ncbi:hypothetical protein B296_00057802, partial [Ensete ventricosum]